MLECRRQIRIIQPSLRYGHTEKNRQIRNNRQTRKNRKARTNRPTEKQGQILKKGQTGQQNFFLMLALFERASFWPPSMVYIFSHQLQITITISSSSYMFSWWPSMGSIHVLHLHLSFWLRPTKLYEIWVKQTCQHKLTNW